jgi:hypothetical protein
VSAYDDPPDLTVSTDVRRPAAEVWRAVADPDRAVEWSPEAHAVHRVSGTTGPMLVGERFSGSNRNGLFRWTTRCVVVESTPGSAFAFDVSYLGLSVARWRHVVTETEAGCRVEAQWWDGRGMLMTALGVVGTGVVDRRTHNTAGMRATLDALARDLGR